MLVELLQTFPHISNTLRDNVYVSTIKISSMIDDIYIETELSLAIKVGLEYV